MKRGQVTLFVVIGLIIIIVVGLGLYFRSSIIEAELTPESVIPIEVEEFKDFVSSCIDQTAKDNLILIGLQGGYLVLPDDSLDLEEDDLTLPFYYDKGENFALEDDDVKVALAFGIDIEAENCIVKESFPKLDIVEDIPTTDITLQEGSVKVSTSYPIVIITAENNSYLLDQPYEFTYPVNLMKILDASRQVTAKRVETPNDFDLEFLLDFDFEIDIIPLENNTEVYSITDPDSILDEEPYQFIFANRFEE